MKKKGHHIDYFEDISCAALGAALHRRCFTPSWNEASFLSAMAIPGTMFELLSLGAKPAAFALYRQISEQAEVLTLGVLPHFRGEGYAGLLLDHGMTFLKSRGAEALLLDVGQRNSEALRLYKARGFIEIARRKNYYHHAARPEDAIVMKRIL